MDKILVAGIDSVVGANLAACLAHRYQVVGLSWSDSIAIDGCQTAVCKDKADEAHHWVASERPNWLIYCGPASHSCWNLPPANLRPEAVQSAGAWARAAVNFGCELTTISSDAVFTGPWMFHRESGSCHCDSSAARILRLIEQEITAVCPDSLLVRTNAYGWAPSANVGSFVETTLQAMQNEDELAIDYMRHATPILATDLVEILERAFQSRLHGAFHIAGGERVNPFRFACLLADQFGMSTSSLIPQEASAEQRREFGAGETSLQTRRIRKTLDMPLPLVREGIARLYEQSISGYRDRFGVPSPMLVERVA